MKLIWARYLYLLSFLFLLHPAFVFSQVLSEIDFLELNYYLINRNYTAVEDFFTSNDSFLTEIQFKYEDRQAYREIKNRYLYLIGFFAKVDSLSMEDCETRIDQYLTFDASYTPEKAGENAHNYYMKFQEQVKAGQKKKALKYYTLSYDGKIRYLRQLNKSIATELKKAEDFLEIKDFRSADLILKSIEVKKQDSYIDNSLQRKLDLLREKTDRGLTDSKIYGTLYDQDEVLSRIYSFTTGLKIQVYGTPVNKTQLLYLRIPSPPFEYQYEIDQMISRIGISFNLNMNHYVVNRYRLGFGFEYGKDYHEFRNLISRFTTDFSINYYALSVSAVYMFRQNPGYRPYLGPGFRYIFLENEIVLPKTNFYTTFDSILEGYHTHVPQFCFNFGFEFVPNLESHFMGELYLQTFINFVRSQIVGDFGVNLGLKLGGIF
jgi:hypothetical protein